MQRLSISTVSVSKRSICLALNKAAPRVHTYLRCDDLPRSTCSLGYGSETMTKDHENAMSYEHSQHQNTWTGKRRADVVSIYTYKEQWLAHRGARGDSSGITTIIIIIG